MGSPRGLAAYVLSLLLSALPVAACARAPARSQTPPALAEVPAADSSQPAEAVASPACAVRIPDTLGAWQRDLRSLDPSRGDIREQYSTALATLQLEALPQLDFTPAVGGGEPALWSLEELELRDTTLAPNTAFVLLIARFELGVSARALRLAIFRRDFDSLCLVSTALSRDIDGRSCLSDQPAFSVKLVRLLSPRTDVIELSTRSGTCDGYAMHRGAHHELELWAVQRGEPDAPTEQLIKLLSLTTFDAWYTSPLPPLQTEETQVSYVGDPPQSVIADKQVICDRWPEHPQDEPCETSETHTEYRYIDGRYQAVR